MKTIEVTIQEIWQATRPIVQKSKKTYTYHDKNIINFFKSKSISSK